LLKAVLANVVKRTASKLYSKDFSMAGNSGGELRKAGGVGILRFFVGYFPLKNLNIRV
jgi:hypothetical protein